MPRNQVQAAPFCYYQTMISPDGKYGMNIMFSADHAIEPDAGAIFAVPQRGSFRLLSVKIVHGQEQFQFRAGGFKGRYNTVHCLNSLKFLLEYSRQYRLNEIKLASQKIESLQTFPLTAVYDEEAYYTLERWRSSVFADGFKQMNLQLEQLKPRKWYKLQDETLNFDLSWHSDEPAPSLEPSETLIDFSEESFPNLQK